MTNDIMVNNNKNINKNNNRRSKIKLIGFINKLENKVNDIKNLFAEDNYFKDFNISVEWSVDDLMETQEEQEKIKIIQKAEEEHKRKLETLKEKYNLDKINKELPKKMTERNNKCKQLFEILEELLDYKPNNNDRSK